MKFAIIADVHANLEAFQAVLADAKEQRCTHYAFLGALSDTAPTRKRASI